MAIKQVGVIGCGLMGSGIAQVSAHAGFPTVVIEANQAFLDKGLGGIRKSLESLVAKAKMDERAFGNVEAQSITVFDRIAHFHPGVAVLLVIELEEKGRVIRPRSR